MATIGLGYFLGLVAGMIWGSDDLEIETPFSQGVLRIGSLVLAYDKLSVIAATIIRTWSLPITWAFQSIAWSRSSERSAPRWQPAPACCSRRFADMGILCAGDPGFGSCEAPRDDFVTSSAAPRPPFPG